MASKLQVWITDKIMVLLILFVLLILTEEEFSEKKAGEKE